MSDLSQRERELLAEITRLRLRIAREETKEFGSGAGSVDTFLDLTDTPSSYAGAASTFVRVNSGGSALVFGTVDWGDIYNKVNAGTATLGIAAFSNSNFTVNDGTVSLGTIYPRYSGAPTAGAMAYWTANGTIAAATFGTAPFAQYSGTASAGNLAYWTGTGTVTANGGFGTANLVLTSGAQTVGGNKAFTGQGSFTNATFPPVRSERTVSGVTNVVRTAFSIKTTTADDMADGFGTGFAFELNDNGLSGQNLIAEITAVRDGGDTSGALVGRTYNGGTVGEVWRATPAGNFVVGAVAAAGKVHIDQSSTTAAIPVLVLDQADLDQPMIEFVTTIGTGNAVEAKGAKTLTTTHFIMIKLPGGLTRYIEAGTIA